MKKLLFIYNVHAGKGLIKRYVSDIVDLFSKSGYLVTAYSTQGKSDAARVAARLACGYDRVVCAGGDGTLNEVITGLMQLETRPVLGYIPTGTTNDFSRNMSLPRGVLRQAAVCLSGIPLPCDIGLFNGDPFVYVAAFGAFTDVSYDTPQNFKNFLGQLAYVLEGVGRISSIQDYALTVEHDGGTLEGDFIFGMVSNTVSVGGLKGLPAKEISLDDGLFEVLLIRMPVSAADLQAILRILALRAETDDGPVIAFHSSYVKVTCRAEAMPWSLDGEYGGSPAVAEIRNCRHAVTIMFGKDRRKSSLPGA